ncbi:MAG: reverse transcriptase domain-containing protein, partial [Candidatus Binatia bacterium]
MKTAKQLFPQGTAFANLCQAFHDASHGKRTKPEVQDFAYHLEERLWEIKHELEAGRYVWGGYRPFWIYDPKKRLIKAASFRDRVVHHALYNILEPLWERSYIRDTYACLSGRGTLAAVRRYEECIRQVAGRGYVLKCDISQYFASVDHAVLQALLRRKLRDETILPLLDSLVKTGDVGGGKGMPIGNLTSQLFANLYLDPCDHFVKEQLGRQYIRYMDDFVIVGRQKRELWEVLAAAREFLWQRLRLSLNPRRTAVLPLVQGVDFLGYVIYPGGDKRIRRRNVVNFRRRLAKLAEGHTQGEVTFAHARSSLASWLGLAKPAGAFRLSRRLFLEHDVRNIGKRLLVK